MADFAAISDATRALNDLLDSPREIRGANKQRTVSLWLYQVIRNPEMLNRPPERPALDKMVRRPLPVNLYYLVTPLAPKTKDERSLLGRVLQVFNDHPMRLADPFKRALDGCPTCEAADRVEPAIAWLLRAPRLGASRLPCLVGTGEELPYRSRGEGYRSRELSESLCIHPVK